jgi:hypothetical protein
MPRILTAVAVLLASVAVVRADGPVGMHIGFQAVKMSREACARKSMSVLAGESFPFAEVMKDGNVQGWDAKSTVLVQAFPTPDPEQVMVFVFAASTDNAEAERLRNKVRTHLVEGKDDGKTPDRIAPAGGKEPARPITLCWKSQEKTATPVVKHAMAAATIVFEKRGMSAQMQAPILLCGGGAGALAAVYLSPTSSGINVQFNTLTAVPGEKASEKLAGEILTRVVGMLYD